MGPRKPLPVPQLGPPPSATVKVAPVGPGAPPCLSHPGPWASPAVAMLAWGSRRWRKRHGPHLGGPDPGRLLPGLWPPAGLRLWVQPSSWVRFLGMGRAPRKGPRAWLAWGWALGSCPRTGCGDTEGKELHLCWGCVGNTQPPEPRGHPLWSRQAVSGACPKGPTLDPSSDHVCMHTHIGAGNTGICVSAHAPCADIHHTWVWHTSRLHALAQPWCGCVLIRTVGDSKWFWGPQGRSQLFPPTT